MASLVCSLPRHRPWTSLGAFRSGLGGCVRELSVSAAPLRQSRPRGPPGEGPLAAWTRRSKGDEPRKTKKSWKQRSEKFLRPFILDVFVSNKFVHAKVMHRVTSRVVAVATTNARELRLSLPCRSDLNACRVVGQLLAERTMDADVFAVVFELRKGDKYDGKIAEVVETFKQSGIAIMED